MISDCQKILSKMVMPVLACGMFIKNTQGSGVIQNLISYGAIRERRNTRDRPQRIVLEHWLMCLPRNCGIPGFPIFSLITTLVTFVLQ